METLNFKPNKNGYILNNYGDIEKLTYLDYLITFGSDETTTPRGVAPRLYQKGKHVYTWGIRGNNHALYKSLETKKEARNFLYKCWESHIDDKNWGAPRFFATKKELYIDLSEIHDRSRKVIKRYFKIKEAQAKNLRLIKVKHDNRPSFTLDMMLKFIADNKEAIQTALTELDHLKQAENKAEWQTKANALIQKVCNNDFRILKWKDVYKLIRENVK